MHFSAKSLATFPEFHITQCAILPKEREPIGRNHPDKSAKTSKTISLLETTVVAFQLLKCSHFVECHIGGIFDKVVNIRSEVEQGDVLGSK